MSSDVAVQEIAALSFAQPAKPLHCHVIRQLMMKKRGGGCKVQVLVCSGEWTAGVSVKQAFKSPGDLHCSHHKDVHDGFKGLAQGNSTMQTCHKASSQAWMGHATAQLQLRVRPQVEHFHGAYLGLDTMLHLRYSAAHSCKEIAM